MKRYNPIDRPLYRSDGDYVRYDEASELIAERDKLLEQREAIILEQQALILKLQSTLQKQSTGGMPLIFDTNISALKATLKAERIKALEDAADCIDPDDCISELRRIANELKEQS